MKNSLPYLTCVLRLSCVVHGPIYGRFMDFYVNGFLSLCKPSVFVCVFLCSTLLNISVSEHLVPSCQCHVWSLKRAWEVCVDLHDHGNHNIPSYKSCSSIIGLLFCSAELKIVFFLVIMWDE